MPRDATDVIEEAKEKQETKRSYLREVANFFHSNEGEMYERYEAIEKLQEHLGEDDERVVGQVLGNLCADRVDPVQNVVKDGQKYVGVIEYHEHGYWYEYVEHDDVEGRVNVGVCAKCVQESTHDKDVAKGIGTTEELAERIEDHYSEVHGDEDVEVETGASLVSGTTIAGNSAIHSANDGAGSGLDADTWRGTHASSLIQLGKGYRETRREVLDESPAYNGPGGRLEGFGLDSNDSHWTVGFNTQSIYHTDKTGSVISAFSTPSNGPYGLDLDSTGCVWHTEAGMDSIFEFNQSGTVQSKFSTPSNSPVGLGVDSTDSIWFGENDGSIYKTSQTGTVQKSIAERGFGCTGLGFDNNDSLWQSDSGNDNIFKMFKNGSLINRYTPSTGGPTGIDEDSTGKMVRNDRNGSAYNVGVNDEVKYE